MKWFCFSLLTIAMILTSCNDETTFKEDDNRLNEKIQSLKSAKSAEDIREVYKYIVTEDDFSDAIEILTDNNRLHLLEHLTLEEPEIVTLSSGIIVQKVNDEYYLEDDIRLTQEQIDMLSNPSLNRPSCHFYPMKKAQKC